MSTACQLARKNWPVALVSKTARSLQSPAQSPSTAVPLAVTSRRISSANRANRAATFKLRNSPRGTAWHVALAVAIGAFGLAVAGMIRSLPTGTGTRPLWLLALVLWPAITAVPAFLVAWIAAVVLARQTRNADVL